MPLPVDVQYLPIHIWEQRPRQPIRRRRPERLPHDPALCAGDEPAVLVVAADRTGCCVARTFGGPWAGRFAVVLLATEPNFLGHASLALTDIAVTRCSAGVHLPLLPRPRRRSGPALAGSGRPVRPGDGREGVGADVRPADHARARSAAVVRRRGVLAAAGRRPHPPFLASVEPVPLGLLQDARGRHGGCLDVLRVRLEDPAERS